MYYSCKAGALARGAANLPLPGGEVLDKLHRNDRVITTDQPTPLAGLFSAARGSGMGDWVLRAALFLLILGPICV
jgi:hypothetical protein